MTRPRLRLLEKPPLLIGAGGMLHRAWAELLAGLGVAQRSPSLGELDLTRTDSIARWLPGTRLVINCAAWTAVDVAEQEEARATAINGRGVGELARLCRENDIFLVHYSTDYVFSGRSQRPYRPEDPLEPLGAYGRSKAAGERLLIESGCPHLLIRTSWLYAPWGQNFVRTIAARVRSQVSLRVVNDQAGRPTSAQHLAETSLRLLGHAARGTWHVCDGGQCTWFELAQRIATHIDPAATVEPCTTGEFPRPAPRPAYSVLDVEKTEALLGAMPHWTENLARVLPRLEP